MEKYIPLDAVVAEIKILLDKYTSVHTFNYGATQDLNHLLSFVETLEVEEVTSIELLKVKGFLVTDKDDYTAIYSTKPNRGRTEWVDGNHPRNANESSCLMTLNNARLLLDIEFNDKPIEVEVVIKAQKGEEV